MYVTIGLKLKNPPPQPERGYFENDCNDSPKKLSKSLRRSRKVHSGLNACHHLWLFRSVPPSMSLWVSESVARFCLLIDKRSCVNCLTNEVVGVANMLLRSSKRSRRTTEEECPELLHRLMLFSPDEGHHAAPHSNGKLAHPNFRTGGIAHLTPHSRG